MDHVLTSERVRWLPRFLNKKILKSTHQIVNSRRLSTLLEFGAQNFSKGPAVLLTDGIKKYWLDDFLTLIALTCGKLGELVVLARYSNQMQEPVKPFDLKRATAS